jgi:amino acid adenylation domain-containing protein
MPLYNKERFIARAIDSVFAQTWQDFEIVVVDDGSTDNGPEIVKSYKDARLRLIQQPNAGPGAARNRGVKESSSEYLAFLDGDDEYFPDYLRRSIDNLNRNPDCVLSVVNHYRGPERTLATTVEPFDIGIEAGPWRLSPHIDAGEMWGSLVYLQTWVVMCRREVFSEFGGFYEHHCTFAEDQYFWLQVILNRKIYRDTTPLFWYHTEDSDLGFLRTRTSAVPVFPFLTDPEPIRRNCPPDYRAALDRMFSFAAKLNFTFMISDDAVVDFWREYLKGIPEAHDLPLDRPRPKERSGLVSSIPFSLDEAQSEHVHAVCEAHSISPNMFFLACLGFLVRKYSSQETVVIGTPYPSQELEEVKGLYGCFIQTVPVRLDLDETSDVDRLFGYVKSQFRSAWEHTSIGLDELIDLSGVPRTPSMNPICQIMYAFRNSDVPRRDVAGSDIVLNVWETSRFEGSLEYAKDLFDAGSVEAFTANLTRVAMVLADGFCSRLDLIDLMDTKAREIVDRTNRTDMPSYLGRTFLELFKETLESCRDMPAVKSGDSTLTYEDLDRLSDGIAERLLSSGAGTGGVVGVYLHRDRWLLPSLIGVFKAGGAFVPLDPQFPRDRLAVIVSDAGIRFVVTVAHLEVEASAIGPGLRTLCADTENRATGEALPNVSPEQTAYILFTSGSTGKPKGVPIRHGSLANLLQAMRFEPGMSRDDTILAFTTITFDVSTLELFFPLICGARILLLGDETTKDTDAIVQHIERENVTYIVTTPSRWALLLGAGLKGRPGMTFISGGEAFPRNLADTLLATGASVWNGYGPTEITVCSSQYRVIPEPSPPCIGKPIANTACFVLDRNNRPLPPGIPGELGIGGAGVSAGYFNRPDLTEGRFVEIDDNGVRRRLYKTGDLVRQSLSGDYWYLGRIDFQVKMRGFRIELGEIEAVMLSFPGIKEAACTVWHR